jgi:Domain of Unknown Function (DUF1080)
MSLLNNRLPQLAAHFISIVFISCLVSAQPVGYADKILGRWDVTVQGSDGKEFPSWLEIQHRKETEIMARVVGHFGSMRYATSAEYKDGQLTITVPKQYERAPDVLVFTGKLNGDTLAGTVQDETGKTVNWTAVRAPEMRRTGKPNWGAPIKLFNGKDLTGWKPRNNNHPNCWLVENGLLTNKTPCADLISDQKFTDFKLHVEFQNVKGGNSGIYLRGRHEVQINDAYGQAADSLRMGGVYGFLKPTVNASKPAAEWQSFDITLIGRRVTIILNGQTIIENEEIPGITGGALDSNEGEAGPLMLQGDHTKVMLRNVTITPVK